VIFWSLADDEAVRAVVEGRLDLQDRRLRLFISCHSSFYIDGLERRRLNAPIYLSTEDVPPMLPPAITAPEAQVQALVAAAIDFARTGALRDHCHTFWVGVITRDCTGACGDHCQGFWGAVRESWATGD
jgi:hypothetical protein